MTEDNKPVGRPTSYTLELGDRICAGIASGKPLVKICDDADFPCTATVYNWLRTEQEFLDNYTRAKDDQADHFVDDMINIADNAKDTQKARLQVETRKWVASKLKAKKYGDSQQLKLADADGNNLNIQRVMFGADSTNTE